MSVAFLLHFYQPSNQFESVFRQICAECYVPLLRYLKNEKRAKISANLSLPFLIQLDKYGYEDLLFLLKELVNLGRLEIVGSGAFHPLFTKLPEFFAQLQIVLHEICLSCYFGSYKDFEGESCFLVKDLKGFFPPELAVNTDFVKFVSEFGYDWVLVDDKAVSRANLNNPASSQTSSFYSLKDSGAKLVVRDSGISNWIAFKRDLEVKNVVEQICQKEFVVVALDAETFGHHYKDGVLLFEFLISELLNAGQEVLTVSEIVNGVDFHKLEHINESTWGSAGDNIYPLWKNDASAINVKIWDLYDSFHNYMILDESVLLREKILNEMLVQGGSFQSFKDFIFNNSLSSVLKLEQSDQFWWSTGVKMGKKTNFSVYMIESVLLYYKQALETLGVKDIFNDKIERILLSLDSNERYKQER